MCDFIYKIKTEL